MSGLEHGAGVAPSKVSNTAASPSRDKPIALNLNGMKESSTPMGRVTGGGDQSARGSGNHLGAALIPDKSLKGGRSEMRKRYNTIKKIKLGGEGEQIAAVVHSSAKHFVKAAFAEEDDNEHAGIGITFWIRPRPRKKIRNADGIEIEDQGVDVCVLSVDREGPADQGILHKGDVLVSVDGRNVRAKDWPEVGPMIEGPVGTSVHIGFERRVQRAMPSLAILQKLHNTNKSLANKNKPMTDNSEIIYIRALRGGKRIVRIKTVWPDPEKYTRTTCFVLTRDTKFRRLCIVLVETPYWDRFILLCIVASTIVVALVDPLDTSDLNPDSPFRDQLKATSTSFTLFFAMEAVVQVIAKGLLFGKTAYIKSPWNWLDGFVVILGMLEFVPSIGGTNLLALRALRVLRPLRAIKRLPALKICVMTLQASWSELLNVLAVIAFIVLVFAIAGVQLLAGVFRNRCFHVEEGFLLEGQYCQDVSGSYVEGLLQCPLEYQCLKLAREPLRGLVHFDNIFFGLMAVTQVLMMEGWVQLMYDSMDAYGPTFVVYFVILVLLGPLFAMNLFKSTMANTWARVTQKIGDVRANRALSFWSRGASYGKAFNQWKLVWRSSFVRIEEHFHEEIKSKRSRKMMRMTLLRWWNLPVHKAWNNWKDRYQLSTKFHGKVAMLEAAEEAGYEGGLSEGQTLEELEKMRPVKDDRPLPTWLPTWAIGLWVIYLFLVDQMARLKWFVYQVRLFSRSKHMESISTTVVIINTLGMTADHTRDSTFGLLWKTDAEHTRFHAGLDILNMTATLFFSVEFLYKLWGWGPTRYFSARINIFDTAIVAISLPEFPALLEGAQCKLEEDMLENCSSANGLSVLRILRLLRLMKLLRSFPNLQAQFQIAAAMVADVAASFSLLCIFLVVYTVLGMSLFGGKITIPAEEVGIGGINKGTRLFVQLPDDELMLDRPAYVSDIDWVNHPTAPWKVNVVTGFQSLRTLETAWAGLPAMSRRSEADISKVSSRSSFDTILQSTISVFQILGGSGWPAVMDSAVKGTNMSYVLFFYSLIFAGSIVLFNLFIAVIIYSFQQHTLEQEEAKNRPDRMPELSRKKIKSVKPPWYRRIWAYLRRKNKKRRNIHVVQQSILGLDDDEDTRKGKATLVGATVWKSEYDILQWAKRVAVNEDPTIPIYEDVKTTTVGLGKYVKGTVIDYTEKEGYRIVYHSYKHVGTDLEENLSPKELEILKTSQVDLDYVQKEREVQGQLDPLSLGWHLSANLDKVIATLRGKIRHLQDLETRTLRWQEFQSEVQRAKSTNRMGRLTYLLERDDLTKPIALTSPNVDDQLQIEQTRHDPWASRIVKQRKQHERLGSIRAVTMDDVAKLENPNFTGHGISVAFYRQERERIEEVIKRIKKTQTALTAGVLTGKSCFCLDPLHPIRAWAASVITNQDFEKLVNALIFGACIVLMIERPLISSAEQEAIDITNLVFNCFFFIEMVLKFIALGFRVYFLSWFNYLDFIIVMASVVDSILVFGSFANAQATNLLGVVKILRIFRALRPLRVILRSSGLRVVVLAVTRSFWPLVASLIMTCMTFTVFGIIGMQLMAGTMHFCSDATVSLETECVGTEVNGEVRMWLNYDRNFDWIGKSLMSAFVVATQDDWQRVLFAAIDGTKQGEGPVQNNKEWLFLYFFAVIVIAAFFQLNMWTGVFVDVYFKAADYIEQERRGDMSTSRLNRWPTRGDLPFIEDVDEDTDWLRKWKPERDGYRVPAYKITTSAAFDQIVAACIVLNIIIMACESYNPGEQQSLIVDGTNLFFSFVFGAEVAAKMYGLQPSRYVNQTWLQFDLFVTMTTFGGLAAEFAGSAISFNPTILRILRVFRIVRLVKAAKIFRYSKKLIGNIEAMYRSLPTVGPIFSLLLVLTLIFSVAGVVLFGHLCIEGDEEKPGTKAVRCLLLDDEFRLGRYANFRNAAMSILSLFRIVTGESWSAVMAQTKLAVDEYPRGENAVQEAAAFLKVWNTTSDDIVRREMLFRARIALPGCMSGDELNILRDQQLVDCGQEGDTPYTVDCQTTCGTVFAQFYFPSFLAVTNFMLVNLVVAVLMRELALTNRDPRESSFVSPKLPKHVFVRIIEVWRTNSMRLRRFNRMLERYNKVTILEDVDGFGQVLALREGEVCTLLGFWEKTSHVLLRTADGKEGICPITHISRPLGGDKLQSTLGLRQHEINALERHVVRDTTAGGLDIIKENLLVRKESASSDIKVNLKKKPRGNAAVEDKDAANSSSGPGLVPIQAETDLAPQQRSPLSIASSKERASSVDSRSRTSHRTGSDSLEETRSHSSHTSYTTSPSRTQTEKSHTTVPSSAQTESSSMTHSHSDMTASVAEQDSIEFAGNTLPEMLHTARMSPESNHGNRESVSSRSSGVLRGDAKQDLKQEQQESASLEILDSGNSSWQGARYETSSGGAMDDAALPAHKSGTKANPRTKRVVVRSRMAGARSKNADMQPGILEEAPDSPTTTRPPRDRRHLEGDRSRVSEGNGSFLPQASSKQTAGPHHGKSSPQKMDISSDSFVLASGNGDGPLESVTSGPKKRNLRLKLTRSNKQTSQPVRQHSSAGNAGDQTRDLRAEDQQSQDTLPLLATDATLGHVSDTQQSTVQFTVKERIVSKTAKTGSSVPSLRSREWERAIASLRSNPNDVAAWKLLQQATASTGKTQLSESIKSYIRLAEAGKLDSSAVRSLGSASSTAKMTTTAAATTPNQNKTKIPPSVLASTGVSQQQVEQGVEASQATTMAVDSRETPRKPPGRDSENAIRGAVSRGVDGLKDIWKYVEKGKKPDESAPFDEIAL